VIVVSLLNSFATIVNDAGIEQSGKENHDQVVNIGGGGDIYVAIGDSITEGDYDDVPGDDTSADGRNTGGGFEPVLNDLLTDKYRYPHSVINEGAGGVNSEEGLALLDSVLLRHPNATKYLIMYGTNDARTYDTTPSGLGLNEGDAGYAGSFKDNVQQMITKIKNANKEPILAKIPRVLGNYNASDVSPDPDSLGRNVNIREFNEVIDELIMINNSIIVTPPDFYDEFNTTYPTNNNNYTEPGYANAVHPDGAGYSSMAGWWNEKL